MHWRLKLFLHRLHNNNNTIFRSFFLFFCRLLSFSIYCTLFCVFVYVAHAKEKRKKKDEKPGYVARQDSYYCSSILALTPMNERIAVRVLFHVLYPSHLTSCVVCSAHLHSTRLLSSFSFSPSLSIFSYGGWGRNEGIQSFLFCSSSVSISLMRTHTFTGRIDRSLC